MWYRLVFDKPSTFSLSKTLLHFGAVDWQTRVYLNTINIFLINGDKVIVKSGDFTGVEVSRGGKNHRFLPDVADLSVNLRRYPTHSRHIQKIWRNYIVLSLKIPFKKS